MSEKLESLKAEKEAASEALERARERWVEAKEAYQAGLLEATGLLGHLVEFERRTWRQKEPETIRFVVEKLGRWSNHAVAGRIVKKDGKMGTREVECSTSVAKDLGVFEAQP